MHARDNELQEMRTIRRVSSESASISTKGAPNDGLTRVAPGIGAAPEHRRQFPRERSRWLRFEDQRKEHEGVAARALYWSSPACPDWQPHPFVFTINSRPGSCRA